MTNSKVAGPDPDEITSWITTTHPDTVIARTMSATFFSLDDRHWPNFATIVTTDEHDMGTPSRLARKGVFRLNIGVGKATFERVVGDAGDAEATGTLDYAALDTFVPHPVYAKQRWIGILNPSRRRFEDEVKPLIEEAYQRLAQPRRRRAG
jgi:hypothetical protein